MRSLRALGILVLALGLLVTTVQAQSLATEVRELESAGNASGALEAIERAIQGNPSDPAIHSIYADFLDRHGDSRARQAYHELLDLATDDSMRVRAAHRLVALDLIEGDRESASRHLKIYRDAGGEGWTGDVPAVRASEPAEHVEIPGPLESFARMAAFSAELEADDVLPALARNVITSGYRVTASYEGLRPTEYMKLLTRYISQARELEQIAGGNGIIEIQQCDSTETADLLRVLGYRMRGGCGSEVILETVNATRAFLTIDAGFPLADLEQALRTNRPFTYDYRPTRVPLIYGSDYWLTEKDRERFPTFIDAFLADPALCRLYLALAKMDRSTVEALRAESSMEQLKAFAHVLDFFGGMFVVEKNGQALLPGGPETAAVWKKLVGVDPRKGGEFFERVAAVDDGWLASYYDSLRRLRGPAKDYLTQPDRLERFYMAIRGKVTSPGPARPVFRSNADLMLLTSGIWTEEDGTPHLPGTVEVWKGLFTNSPSEIYDGKLKKTAGNWADIDDVLEAMFGMCRKPIENQPLRIYIGISSINRHRNQHLGPGTVDILARNWHKYGDQYQIFSESPWLSDATIRAYVSAAEEIDDVNDRRLRADAAGSLQALAGLWQIFVRHGEIAPEIADSTLGSVVKQFEEISNRRELFAQMRKGVEVLAQATDHETDESHQRHFLALLTGSSDPADEQTHAELIDEMRRIFEAQRLVSLDAIFDLDDHLEALANGAQLDTAIVNRLADRLEDLATHREALSSVEKNAISFGYWSERHIERQQKMRWRNEIRKAVGSADDLRGLRSELAGILRDTLVGYNYLHYAPPGAQLLRTNPLFVRGHDFIGISGTNETWQEAEVHGTGWPSSAGGRLVGSLSGLAYALAESEQNFLIPQTEQALIWTDLVPQMMLTAKVPRWWSVSPELLHWTALHVRVARTAVAEAVLDTDARERVVNILEQQATPARLSQVAEHIETGDVPEALDNITPSEMLLIGQAVSEDGGQGPLVSALRALREENPGSVSYEDASRAFGSPKPKLMHTYRPQLMHLRTFPTLMGYSSRIMAESWESNLIYYCALADELYLRPSQLNVQVPEWTRVTVETIFATHLEDWPAVLRSLRRVGDEVRTAARRSSNAEQRAVARR